MVSRYEGTRMFHMVTKTWNPVTGCRHGCVYCWARRLVETRLKKVSRKYRRGFEPALHEGELNPFFRPGELVFTVDMGDLFGDWVPEEWIYRVLEVVGRFPRTTFLFLTKNPRRYYALKGTLCLYSNAIFGATIETDSDEIYTGYGVSSAPPPSERIRYMKALRFLRRMVSVEPVIDFTDGFWQRIVDIEPEFVYIGYDNYGNRLPEPPLNKTLELVDRLRQHGITVYTKTMRKAWWEGNQ